MEPIQTATSSPLAGIAISIVIFLSEVVFQWVPAIIHALTGVDVTATSENVPIPLSAGTQPSSPSPVLPAGEAIPFPGTSPQDAGFTDAARDFFRELAQGAELGVGVLIFLSLLFITGLIYAFIRLGQVKKQEERQFRAMYKEATAASASGASRQWENIEAHANSENPSDWRLAIIEADILLDRLLDKLGYTGETTGEKMRQVERSDFRTIDDAWEAHKLRNDIAHRGAERELSQREVRSAIRLYERVFREHGVL